MAWRAATNCFCISYFTQEKPLGAIDALKKIKSQVVFDIYGPAEDQNYWAQCQESAKLLPQNIRFQYCGALQPMQVPDKLAEYDLFFLPTLGENFGHVIAEALSSGLPVLISDTTPWRDLAENPWAGIFH